MEGHAERSNEDLPKVSWADYMNRMEVVDMHSDPHRSKGMEVITEEAYGMIEGWDDDNSYIHEITSAKIGIKMQTKACVDELASPNKSINSPDDVEFYTMWIVAGDDVEKVYINSTDAELAREIHKSFLEKLMESGSLVASFQWLITQSPYSKMKSPIDTGVAVVDHISMSSRKKIRETR